MAVSQETVLTIVCDNAACPGNTLDPGSYTGWTVVSTETHGEVPLLSQFVYCSTDCAGTVGNALRDAEAE